MPDNINQNYLGKAVGTGSLKRKDLGEDDGFYFLNTEQVSRGGSPESFGGCRGQSRGRQAEGPDGDLGWKLEYSNSAVPNQPCYRTI